MEEIQKIGPGGRVMIISSLEVTWGNIIVVLNKCRQTYINQEMLIDV